VSSHWKNIRFETRFKPVVKLFKWWRRENKTGKRPKGFVLEVLVAKHAPRAGTWNGPFLHAHRLRRRRAMHSAADRRIASSGFNDSCGAFGRPQRRSLLVQHRTSGLTMRRLFQRD
jgi:hypothetical protein